MTTNESALYYALKDSKKQKPKKFANVGRFWGSSRDLMQPLIVLTDLTYAEARALCDKGQAAADARKLKDNPEGVKYGRKGLDLTMHFDTALAMCLEFASLSLAEGGPDWYASGHVDQNALCRPPVCDFEKQGRNPYYNMLSAAVSREDWLTCLRHARDNAVKSWCFRIIAELESAGGNNERYDLNSVSTKYVYNHYP
jgi:hypothetical protein